MLICHVGLLSDGGLSSGGQVTPSQAAMGRHAQAAGWCSGVPPPLEPQGSAHITLHAWGVGGGRADRQGEVWWSLVRCVRLEEKWWTDPLSVKNFSVLALPAWALDHNTVITQFTNVFRGPSGSQSLLFFPFLFLTFFYLLLIFLPSSSLFLMAWRMCKIADLELWCSSSRWHGWPCLLMTVTNCYCNLHMNI